MAKKNESGMSEREKRLKAMCDAINKSSFGGSGNDAVTYLGSKEAIKMVRFSSGCPALDDALGGGWPRGRFIEVYGPEAGGKTTLGLHGISEFQKAFPDDDIGVIDAEYCLAKGTLVYDAEKMIYSPVEDILDRGQEFSVASWVGGEIIKQTARVRESGIRPVFMVCCKGGRSIHLTGNHRVLTQDGYKEVDELAEGDSMFVPSNIPAYGRTSPPCSELELYRLLGYHIGDGSRGKVEIATVDYAVVEDLSEIAEKNGCSVTFSGTLARFRKKELKFSQISKESLIEMFDSGMLVEEVALECGCSVSTVGRKLDEYGLREKYNFMQMAAIARNSRATSCEKANSCYAGGNKSELYGFLSGFESFWKYSGDRRMPEGLTTDQLSQVIAGMWMADGTVVDPLKQRRCSASYATTSRILAMDLQVSLQRLGIYSTISSYEKEREGGGHYKTCYSVHINGWKDMNIFHKVMELTGYKRERLEMALQMVNPKKSMCTRQEGGLIPVPVLSVEPDGEVMTYDVSVNNPKDEEQNFLSEGMIVHNSFDAEYARNIGVDTKYLIVHQPEGGEQALNITNSLIQSGVKLILFDSVAALLPKAEIEGDIGDIHVAQQARLMSGALRRLAMEAGKRDATIIWTNQLREKINVTWGDKTTTPAGRALRHYASIRVNVARIGSVKEKIDGEDVIVSNKVRADVKKNKTAAPFRRAEFFITFGTGIDKAAAFLDVLFEKGVVHNRGSWITDLEGETLGQGRPAVLDMLRNDKEWEAKLREKLKAVVEGKLQPVDKKGKKAEIKRPKLGNNDPDSIEGEDDAVSVEEV